MSTLSLSDTPPASECKECGAAISPTAKFCGECGAIQPLQAVEVAAWSMMRKNTSFGPEDMLDELVEQFSSQNSLSHFARRKSVLIGVVIGAVVLTVVAVVTLSSPEKRSVEVPANPTQSASPVFRILTKSPELMQFLHPPSGDELLRQSAVYEAKKNEIDLKLASINDPELKKRLGDEEWGKVDFEDYKRQARASQVDSVSAGLRAFLEGHRSDWFEVGHLSFSGTNSLQVSSVEASPIMLPNGADIPIDIGQMDAVYSKFRELAGAQIEAKGREWISGQSCQAKLRNVCVNLGGSQGECSDPAKLSEISRTLGGSGIQEGCNDNASLEEGMKTAEAQMRPARIVLVGQGDLISHRIDKLLIVDYDTEIVLHEFSPSVLPDNFSWKYPDDKHHGLFSSSSYRTFADSDGQTDFGVVPVGSKGTDVLHATYTNSSFQQASVAVSLEGDPDGEFELANGCSSGTIYAQDHCTVTVSFKPANLGLHRATLSVTGMLEWHPILLNGFSAWPWDIYRGEKSAIIRTARQ